MEPKYKNDENVLETIPAQYRPISIESQSTPPRMVSIRYWNKFGSDKYLNLKGKSDIFVIP